MKKLIFGGFAVLLALALITCEGETPIIGDDGDLIDVEYSADGRSLTIYLEGGVRQSKSERALTVDNAKFGHDYFEVVFYAAADRIARASWELGESVGVKNVPRNIDYSLTGVTTVADGTLTAPVSGSGYATLFVGRRTDKTLLAVGRLVNVDGNGTPTTTVTGTSKTVTFEVAALEAGARLLANDSDSALATDTFLTAARYVATNNEDYDEILAAHTIIATRSIGTEKFPMFELPPYAAVASVNGSPTCKASYTISSNAGSDTETQLFFNSIRLADSARSAPNATTDTRRIPRYPVGDKYNYLKLDLYDSKTTVVLDNNNTGAAGVAFNRQVEFLFTTTNGQTAGLFSFYFQIPVLAISPLTPGNVDAPITWVIRSGSGTSLVSLDNGKGGSGSCILMAYMSGNIDVLEVDYEFKD